MSTSLSEWFGFLGAPEASELPNIFPFPILESVFIETDIVTIFQKILTDVLERTSGLTDEQQALMWDSAVMSSSSEGLVTRLARAMAHKKEIFLVLDAGVLRPATSDEEVKIREDYKNGAESSTGIFVSFKNFARADMIRLYTLLEFCTVAALHKSMNLSKAVQLKFSDLRQSVNNVDAAVLNAKAQEIATSLAKGNDVFIDAKDSIETNTPDLTAVKASIEFLAQKRSFYLGLPAAYILGEQTGGLSTTGEGDARAVERGLRSYYFSVIKPVVEAIFGDVSLSYKSQDFKSIAGSMDILKTFALTDDTLISAENKRKILNRALELPEDEQGDPAPKPEPVAITAQPGSVPKPVQNQPPKGNA